MRNFTEMGYETITVIRSEYEPKTGKCLSISPVLWIQTIEKEDGSKEDRKYFVFSKNNCIKEIYEISQAVSNYIDGIITPCGTILPINNKIEFLESEGIGLECVEGKLKFVIKAPLDPSLGGTGFITYNEGDILLGNKDGKLSILLKGQIGQALGIKEDGTVGYIDVIKKLTCSDDAVTENALTRWNADGNCLKDSKTVQDDEGNTNTRTSIDGTLNFITANNSEDPESSAVHALEATGGRPIRRYLIPEKQLVDSYIDNKDYSYNIFLNNLEEGKGSKNCFRINREGNITIPNQYTAFAILTENTGSIPNEKEYFLGQGTPLTIVSNKGGYFFAGGGSVSNPANFTVFEENTFQVYTSAYITTSELTQTEITARIRVTGSRSRSTAFLIVQGDTIDKGSAFVQTGVEGLPGDIIKFSFYARSGGTTQTWKLIKEIGDTYTTFVGIRCLG